MVATTGAVEPEVFQAVEEILAQAKVSSKTVAQRERPKVTPKEYAFEAYRRMRKDVDTLILPAEIRDEINAEIAELEADLLGVDPEMFSLQDMYNNYQPLVERARALQAKAREVAEVMVQERRRYTLYLLTTWTELIEEEQELLQEAFKSLLTEVEEELTMQDQADSLTCEVLVAIEGRLRRLQGHLGDVKELRRMLAGNRGQGLSGNGRGSNRMRH